MTQDGAAGPARPPSIPRLPALDGIRFIAATAVVLQHVGFQTGVTTRESWGGWISIMDFAVAVFFVLSGFVLFQPWARAAVRGEGRPTMGKFLWRRFARILPGYWAVVTVCLLVLPPNGPAPLSDWLRHLGLTQIYTFAAIRRGLGQTWTLCIEASLYFVLPIAAVLVIGKIRPWRRWRPRRTVALTAIGSVLVSAAWLTLLATGVLDLKLHILWLPAYALWFGIGISLCAAYVALRSNAAPRSWSFLDRMGGAPLACWGVALGLLAIASTPVTGPRGLAAPTAAEFGTELVLYAGVATMIMIPLIFGPPTRLRTFVGSRPMRWLGTLGYSIFLWHPFVLEMIYEITGWRIFSGRLTTVFAITMAGSLVLAILSYYLVERPLMRLANHFPKGRRPKTVETHSVPNAINAAA